MTLMNQFIKKIKVIQKKAILKILKIYESQINTDINNINDKLIDILEILTADNIIDDGGVFDPNLG